MTTPPDIDHPFVSGAEEDSPAPSCQDVSSEEVLPGHSVSVFTYNHQKFFLGVQLAELLHRETFNLYRSMKIKRVIVSRATRAQIAFLQKVGAVRAGTHSVTLLDYETSLAFLRETVKKRRSESDITRPARCQPEGEPPTAEALTRRRVSLGGPLTPSPPPHHTPPTLHHSLSGPLYSAPGASLSREPLPRHQQRLGASMGDSELRDAFDATPLPPGRWFHHPQAPVPMLVSPHVPPPSVYAQQPPAAAAAAVEHREFEPDHSLTSSIRMQNWFDGAGVSYPENPPLNTGADDELSQWATDPCTSTGPSEM